MFEFLNMLDDYEERAVDRFEGENGLIVDTVAIDDSDLPFETAVKYPLYNEGDWVVVEQYETSELAQEGHDKWVATMTADKIPAQLETNCTASIAKLNEAVGNPMSFELGVQGEREAVEEACDEAESEQ